MNEFTPIEDGILLVDKPAGMSSFKVVAIIRSRLTKYYGRKIKVGHTGTLDPFATGLMILVIGKECKNAANYSKLSKVYEADVILGSKSSTGDPEGEISLVSDIEPTEDSLRIAVASFKGNITQRPPMFSAIKIDGQRAYKLAREGKEFEVPLRQVTINDIKLITYKYPQFKIYADVSSGTYIRTLAEDIGETLGVGAYCKELRRLSIDKWHVNDAIQID
jgi:tRNA pseudouridine55 synthase